MKVILVLSGKRQSRASDRRPVPLRMRQPVRLNAERRDHRGLRQAGDRAPSRQGLTRVELAGTSKVIVRARATKSVVVRGDDNLLHLITTEVRDGTLVVSQKGDFTSQRGIEVIVATPSLVGAKLSGTGSLAVTGVHDKSFEVDLSGTGSLDANGSTNRVDVTLSGVGDARLRQLVSAETHVVLSGTGSASVVATKSLDASLSGSGSITYYGLPQHVKTNITGTGAIHPG
jgi:hypothetical protein